jgi:hypothetical protein
MIGQDRKPQHINAETRRQETKSILQPLFAMVVVIAAKRIVAAQKAPPHATINAMEDRDFAGIKHIRTSKPSHCKSPELRLLEL